MFFRKLFFAIVILLFTPSLKAQKIPTLIPYRQGKLWGMADTTGKIIVAPQYDYVEFNSIKKKSKYTLPEGYYYVVIDSLIGVISNKEIIPPLHGIIECFDGVIFAAAPKKNSNPVFYTMQGKRIIKDSCTIEQAIWSYENPQTGKPMYDMALGFSLLIFYAFAMQCMSTLATTYRETKSWKYPLIQFGYMTALAYLSAFLVYQALS